MFRFEGALEQHNNGIGGKSFFPAGVKGITGHGFAAPPAHTMRELSPIPQACARVFRLVETLHPASGSVLEMHSRANTEHVWRSRVLDGKSKDYI